MSDSDTDPPSPPFESGTDTATDPGTVRERVRGVAMTLTDEHDVKTIAEMADCSKEGARTALREYAEVGLVTRTNEDPERYERNPAFLRFRRGFDVATESTPEELRAEYQELRKRHETFAGEFDADHPRAVEDVDKLPREDREAVSEWQGVIERASDVREAYWQHERKALPALDTRTETGTVATATGEQADSAAAVEGLVGLLHGPDPSASLGQALVEEVASNEDLRRALLSALLAGDVDFDEANRIGSTNTG